jgi:AP-1 complex subunit gamma-1
MSSLKSFIKAVRASKTLADERAVIQKESAAIRTSFRENYTDSFIRRQNVSKLLYLFTLGERTHFGQVECLKLLATSRFTDKRLGYLGTMLLLDENQEVLTLVTNSLSNDLAHSNQYVVALALCTLANIASTEMARDLFADVQKILSSSNPYLKKKAGMYLLSRSSLCNSNCGDHRRELVNWLVTDYGVKRLSGWMLQI